MKRIMLVCILLCLFLCGCGKKEKPLTAAPDASVFAHNRGILAQYCKSERAANSLEELLSIAYSLGNLDQIEIKSAYWKKNVPYHLEYSDETYYSDYLVLDMESGMQIWSYYSYGSFYAITNGSPGGRLLAGIIE